MNKKVSIILPSYNGERFLKDSIDSVINQTYSNWELIIINDCSTDNTLNIANEYAQKDSRIKVISNEHNLKLPASLNVGFRNASGEYYTWTSDDNMYKPKALETMVEYLDNNPTCDLVSFNFDFITEDCRFENQFTDLVLNRNMLQLTRQCNVGACFMYRKNIADKTGSYNENMFCAEDYDYWCRIALNGNISYQDQNLYKYRNNSQSLTATKQKTIQEKTMDIRLRYTEPLMDKLGFSNKEKIKHILDFYYREGKNDKWLELAKNIDSKLTKKYQNKFIQTVKLRSLEKFFSVKNEYSRNRKYKVVSILGIKIKSKINTNKLTKKDMESLKDFEHKYIRNNSVLIVEPNSYHGEILPGFIKYFQDLGYNVDLLLRDENVKDKSFFACKNINYVSGSALFLKTILKLPQINNYEFVFFSSSAYWEKDIIKDSFLNYLEFIPQSKYGIMMIEHNINHCLLQYNETKYLENNRLFTLAGFQNTPMLNPHYFKDIEIKPRNSKTKFIIAGHCEKGSDILFSGVYNLVKNGVTNFEVNIIGHQIDVPDKMKDYIKTLGHLSFKEMYKEVESADFVLPMLAADNKNFEHYLSGTTSGAVNLALGFLKPLCISEVFGLAYHFQNTNSIFYEGNNLADGMKAAIKLSNENYATMQNNLKVFADNIYSKSLNNLKNSIEKIKMREKIPQNFVMFCKTYSGDLERFKIMIDSFNRYNFDNIKMYVSVPETDLKIFEKYKSHNVCLLSDESYAGKYFADKTNHGFSLGYFNQEICKLAFWETGTSKNYLALDADAQFIRPFYVSDFMADNETPYTVLVQDKDLLIEKHYYEYGKERQCYIEKIYNTVGLNDKRYRTCHGMQVLNSKVLKSLKDDFMSKSYTYKDLVEIAPFEFTWYNAWFQKCALVKELAVEPFFKVFHMREDYLYSRAKCLDINDYKKQYVGIVLNGNWNKPEKYYHKPDKMCRFINKLIKKTFRLLGLKYWNK